MKRAIRMDAADHVATLLENAQSGDEIGIYDTDNTLLYVMTACENIPFGNKIALSAVNAGSLLIKYGVPIGLITKDIRCGHLVHVHNVKSRTVDIPPNIRQEIMRQMNITEEI